jgi:hypothetical protein
VDAWGAGTLTLAVEELPNQNASVRFKVRGENFPSCQPFVRVSRTKELMGGALETTPVYRTEVRHTTTLPHAEKDMAAHHLEWHNMRMHERALIDHRDQIP